MFAILLVLMADPIPVQPGPGVEEALKLADELINLKEYKGHLIKADALSRKGAHAEALQEYALGVKKLGTLPPEYSNLLDDILKRGPNLTQPTPKNPPKKDFPPPKEQPTPRSNPELAGKAYGDGLGHFHAGRFSDAEREFSKAVYWNNGDARYHYFLGLSRWQQGQSLLATEDFRQGTILERQAKPNPRELRQSLEFVQGPLRQVLDDHRSR